MKFPDPAEAAVLPFRIVESLGFGCGYERSFRLSAAGIDANRYLLGINTADTTAEQWRSVANALGMPVELAVPFHARLADANLVFIGFEAGTSEDGMYKLYLEFWDKLRRELEQDPQDLRPRTLHLGFKWKVQEPARHVVTTYRCTPRIDHDAIASRIQGSYGTGESTCREPVLAIHRRMAKAASDRSLIYVDAGEAGNPRQSFDINYYSANRRVGDIADLLTDIAEGFSIAPALLDRLLQLAGDKVFGHLSAGLDRTGREYCTIYYES